MVISPFSIKDNLMITGSILDKSVFYPFFASCVPGAAEIPPETVRNAGGASG
jgi:hypothetical protein